MDEQLVSYVYEQITCHVERFFTSFAFREFAAAKIRFVPMAQVWTVRGPSLVIPTDCSQSAEPRDVAVCEFGGTSIAVWNLLERPSSADWYQLPSDGPALWYVHATGTMIPAYDLFGNVARALTLAEEIACPQRDAHGRFVASMSERNRAGLLRVPLVNDAAAVLVAAARWLKGEGDLLDLGDAVRAPVLVLSHDVDMLRGDDRWTQMARVYRGFAPLMRGRPLDTRSLRAIRANAERPWEWYLHDIDRMVQLESEYGFRSAFYILNGTAGRYGARYGERETRAALDHIPSGWPVGMHYNYDTLLDAERFSHQRSELSAVAGQAPNIGRAHYLRFDPCRSLRFLDQMGMAVDETLGYPDAIGYRAGIAGPYRPWDARKRASMTMLEVPLAIMDGALDTEWGDRSVDVFVEMLDHVRCVGGAISLLTHPGTIDNPERPGMRGVYARLLSAGADAGARGVPCSEFL